MRKKHLNKIMILLLLYSSFLICSSCKNTVQIAEINKTSGDDQNENLLNEYKISFRRAKTDKIFSVYIGQEYEKIYFESNNNLEKAFSSWVPEKFNSANITSFNVALNNDMYLSAGITYAFVSNRTEYARIYNTLNIQTSEILFLNDIFEIDEEFTSLLLTEGIPFMEYNWIEDKENYPYSQKNLDERNPQKIFEQLKKCSEPYNEKNWIYKPTFYLTKDRLYLLGIFSFESETYINIKDIEHKLIDADWR